MLILNNKATHTYTTGYFINNANVEIAFKYRVLDREDIEEIDLLRGIEAIQLKKVVGTTSGINFTPGSRVKIDGVPYIIANIYREPNELENGMFVSGIHMKETFLNLTR